MIVVSDTSPLTNLAAIGTCKVSLLHTVADFFVACFVPHNPHRRFFKRLILISDFRNGLLVPDGRPFLLNFSGFLPSAAVQEHSNDWFATVQRRLSPTEPTVQNRKTLTVF